MEDDLFIPKEIYVGSYSKPIIFDSECSITVTPHAQNFVGEFRSVNKSILGLNGTTEVEGEGMVEWMFRDDYEYIKQYRQNPSSSYHLK